MLRHDSQVQRKTSELNIEIRYVLSGSSNAITEGLQDRTNVVNVVYRVVPYIWQWLLKFLLLFLGLWEIWTVPPGKVADQTCLHHQSRLSSYILNLYCIPAFATFKAMTNETVLNVMVWCVYVHVWRFISSVIGGSLPH